jgi:ABC-type nickel/cobalt efflux system permease component RcnA
MAHKFSKMITGVLCKMKFFLSNFLVIFFAFLACGVFASKFFDKEQTGQVHEEAKYDQQNLGENYHHDHKHGHYHGGHFHEHPNDYSFDDSSVDYKKFGGGNFEDDDFMWDDSEI